MASSSAHTTGPAEDARPREVTALPRREMLVEAVAGVLFAGAAAALLASGAGGGTVRWDVAALLAVTFAATVRAQFDVGAGYVPATQLAFVPALLLVPARWAPIVALAGWLLGRLPDLLRGELHPSRLLLVPGNCLFAIGPAAILATAAAPGPHWGDWPLYLAALAAQFAGDLVSGTARAWAALGVAPPLQLRVLAYVWLVDGALAPIGLLAAFASTDGRFAFLGVLPLAGLLVVFSHERTLRLDAERSSVRAREALLAGASHEMQTPLAVLTGLVETLARNPDLEPGRRSASVAAMLRQTGHLRHLVGQFVTYAQVKAGQRVVATPRPVPAASALEAAASLWSGQAAVAVEADEAVALADPALLHQVLMALLSNAVKHAPAEAAVELRARRAADRVVIEVADRGPGLADERLDAVFEEVDRSGERTEGSGLGLFLARMWIGAQGGEISLRNRPSGGLAATVVLPAADAVSPARAGAQPGTPGPAEHRGATGTGIGRASGRG